MNARRHARDSPRPDLDSCDDALVLASIEVTAAAEMDLFISVHGAGHDVRMVIDVAPDERGGSATAG